MAHLFLITGPSGAGKSSILKALLQDPALHLERFITTTTREMRPGEVNGEDYWFIPREAFIKQRDQDKFYEWAEVYGKFYGSPKREYEQMQESGKNKIMVIDVQGAEALKKRLPEVITLFVDASIEEMSARIRARCISSEDELSRRIEAMKLEKTYKDKADYVVANTHGKLDQAIQAAKKIIQSNL